MHLVFFSCSTSLYGAGRSLLALIEGLAASGIACTLVTPRKGEIHARVAAAGAVSVLAPIARWVSRGTDAENRTSRLRANCAAVDELIRKLPVDSIDLVYSNSLLTHSGALFAERIGKPHIWHLREYCADDYDLDFDLHPDEVRRILLASDALVANSCAVRDHHLGGDVHANIHVVPNGVISRAAMESDELRPAPPSEEPVFALVGRMIRGKGQIEAIRAIALVRRRYPNARLVLAGDGFASFETECREQARALSQNGAVEFLGFVRSPWRVYRSARAVLMCSRSEAFGRVSAEAMAAGRPVIGVAAGGTPEVVEHERTGLLYDGSVDALAAAMIRIIEEPGLAERLGAAGRLRVIENFTTERYVAGVRRVIDSVLQCTGAVQS